MYKQQITSPPGYFDRYIALAPETSLAEAMRLHAGLTDLVNPEQLEALGDRVYAPGKWTIRDIIQHITDTERIFAYRALRFARNDATGLPGFDEGVFAAHTTAGQRTLADLVEEMKVVRQGTEWLFRSFSEEMLRREGTASGNRISVLALGFTIIGHPVHHFNIIRERYLPLL